VSSTNHASSALAASAACFAKACADKPTFMSRLFHRTLGTVMIEAPLIAIGLETMFIFWVKTTTGGTGPFAIVFQESQREVKTTLSNYSPSRHLKINQPLNDLVLPNQLLLDVLNFL
jgi:hypothetical protein